MGRYLDMAKQQPRMFVVPIKEVVVDNDNVYITDKYGDTWRFYIEHDHQPVIELIERG